jgi:hypothetical protein
VIYLNAEFGDLQSHARRNRHEIAKLTQESRDIRLNNGRLLFAFFHCFGIQRNGQEELIESILIFMRANSSIPCRP